jgi:WD40 repeat protein
MQQHPTVLYAVTYAPDGKTIATGGADGVIRLWDAAAGESRGELTTPAKPLFNTMAFSPDGTHLLAGGNDNIARIWDMSARRVVLELRGHANFLTAVAFTPDGDQVVTGDWGGEMRVWDAHSGQLLAVFHGHRSDIQAIAISPDGTQLLSISSSGPARLTACDVCGSVAHLLAIVDARGTRDLTADERRRFERIAPPAASPVATPIE